METNLYIDLVNTIYLPGDTVTGKILWALNEPPEQVLLSLGWWTEGRGSKDAKIESELEWDTMEVAGERAFQFHLPNTPSSFNGQLISLKWGLELTVLNGDEKQVTELIVSPHGVPVELPKVKDESSGKSFSFIRNR